MSMANAAQTTPVTLNLFQVHRATPNRRCGGEKWMLKQVQHDECGERRK